MLILKEARPAKAFSMILAKKRATRKHQGLANRLGRTSHYSSQNKVSTPLDRGPPASFQAMSARQSRPPVIRLLKESMHTACLVNLRALMRFLVNTRKRPCRSSTKKCSINRASSREGASRSVKNTGFHRRTSGLPVIFEGIQCIKVKPATCHACCMRGSRAQGLQVHIRKHSSSPHWRKRGRGICSAFVFMHMHDSCWTPGNL